MHAMSFWGCGQGTTKHHRWGAVAWLDDGKSIDVLIKSFEDMCACMCICTIGRTQVYTKTRRPLAVFATLQ
jgi:hypothetical protein